MTDPLRAVDANALLRYLLKDVPDQAKQARHLIDSAHPLGLTAVTLAEVAWTLAGPRYRRARPAVARQLIDLQEIYSFDRHFARAGLTPVPLT